MSNFSVVCGTRACNAACPFCISRMTAACVDEQPVEFDWAKFEKAIRYVEGDVRDVLITGRGEPTLYRDHLILLISQLNEHFPNIELQTNGVLYQEFPCQSWVRDGLNTIAISVASLNNEMNRMVMGIKGDFSVRKAIQYLSERFTIRVSYQLTLRDGPHQLVAGRPVKRCSATDWFSNTINDAKSLGAKQITFRKIGKPDETKNQEAAEWVNVWGDPKDYSEVFAKLGKKLATYSWGGMIYDINGMSVCVVDCLTENPNAFEPRSWIFDGKHLRYSWQHEGAIIF